MAKILRIKNTKAQLTHIQRLNINQVSALDEGLLKQLLELLDEFDFIFFEPPALDSSTLFLNPSRLNVQSIIIVSPQDTRNRIEWFINDTQNLGIIIDQVIYNNPRNKWIKSVYAVESYNQ